MTLFRNAIIGESLVRQEAYSCNHSTYLYMHIAKCTFPSILYNLHNLLITKSGDIELNPGPSSSADSSSVSSADSYIDLLNSGLSVMYLNIQSIKPKLDILQIEAQPYDVLIFTETWLSQSTLDDDLHIANFNAPFRCDRVDRQGGGVAIYVRDCFHATRRHDLSVNGIESIWIELHTNQKKLLIGGIYRPPGLEQ